MPTAFIDRAAALALIQAERSRTIIQMVEQQSVALATMRRVPIGTNVWEYPVVETFPDAQWLAADDSAKPVTTMSWSTKQVKVEEIAAIALIPENVVDDSSYNLANEIESRVSEAIAIKLDMAVFFGTGAPASFPVGGAVGRAIAAGHEVPAATPTPDPIDSFSDAMGQVEDDGYSVDQAWAARSLGFALRTLRDNTGRPLLYDSVSTGPASSFTVLGVPLALVGNGAWDNATAAALVGDSQYGIILVRQDVTLKWLDQATIGDVNLAERDMLGVRAKARFGFTIVAPKGRGQSATPFPFSAITGALGKVAGLGPVEEAPAESVPQ